ncbi:hypothetical protein TNCV_945781 [Trichonephila clavipes]|nr:hypothetical protein TNCV_945781 [Trichonephila clavipes]
MRRLASESCFYTREKQELAFDWLEREAERDFGGAMKDNGVEPFCTQERVQQNSFDPSYAWLEVNIPFHSVKFLPICLRWARRTTFVLETPSIPIKRGRHNHSVPSIFGGDLFSFLDEFERDPMDLTMPRLNSCVKKSIGFKPIQPMDLSVNSSIAQ